jgi:hypothetical protein
MRLTGSGQAGYGQSQGGYGQNGYDQNGQFGQFGQQQPPQMGNWSKNISMNMDK